MNMNEKINIQNFRDVHKEYADYAYFIYGLMRQYQPKQVFEVGLGPHGHTSFSILTAASENNILGFKYYVLDYNPTNMMTVRRAISKAAREFNLDIFYIPKISVAIAKIKNNYD
jgi:predicted O-methyltransferase YrrM